MRAHAYSQTAQKWFQAIWIFIIKFIKQHQATILVNWIGFVPCSSHNILDTLELKEDCILPHGTVGPVGQVELDPTRRASTVCTDLRRHSIISQPQGSDDPSLLLATPESRVELLHNLGLNRESEAHGTPWGNGENWRVIGCGSKGFEMFRNYLKLPRSE